MSDPSECVYPNHGTECRGVCPVCLEHCAKDDDADAARDCWRNGYLRLIAELKAIKAAVPSEAPHV